MTEGGFWDVPIGPLSEECEKAEILGLVTIDGKGRAAFPQGVRQALGLVDGTQLRIERGAGGRIELVPVALIARDQLYFHSPEMRERLAQAERSFADGSATRTNAEAETQALLDALKTR